MNTGMLNGFAGVTQSVTTNGYETRHAISDLGYALKDCLNIFFTAIKNRFTKVNTVGSLA